MLRILVVIECDGCNGVLANIAVAENPLQLPTEIHDLQLTAEENAWLPSKHSTVHYCPECSHPTRS
jgi:hypothetical protein